MVSTLATIYKKLKLDTHENLGWGKIHLPETELHTTACWLCAGPGRGRRLAARRARHGARRRGPRAPTVGSLLLMSDPRDLGMVAQVRSPHAERPVIYLYESVPGGVGLATRLWERHAALVAGALDLVRACACDDGCPACVGPAGSGAGGKPWARRLLTLLSGTAALHPGVAEPNGVVVAGAA